MSDILKQLAGRLNIATSYSYFCGGENVQCEASDELLKLIIEDMGYNAKNDDEIVKSINRFDKIRWQRAMEAIYVCSVDEKEFDIVLSKSEYEGDIFVSVSEEGKDDFSSIDVEFDIVEERSDVRTNNIKVSGKILSEVAPNYYDLKVETNKNTYFTKLAVAPKECYKLDKKGKEKLFGFAIQLYSLKSKNNWGVGDFTDLENMVDLLADNGGDVIGLNPLNVLLNDYPEQASPYASISRLFLNPIYIDVERVPFYEESDKDVEAICKSKEKETIDYTLTYNAKIKALKAIYARLMQNKNSEYYREFEEFKNSDSGDLHKLAVFQAISSFKAQNGGNISKELNASLSSSMGKGVEKFAKEHKEEIDFFKFLQFESDRQLKLVEKKIKDRGLIIGLYRDLPVGVSKDSTEVWNDRSLYFAKSGAGAPPDSYFPTGQKWGLGAFNPIELKERCYKPFIRILRANMRYAGAIRIDHIMGLSRLFIIPDKGEDGTYIYYNAKDMMNLLALESYLNKCVVVGECIGNVEGGFSESLLARNIYLLGVLWSERKDANGTMKKPHEYESKYFASVGTHDMPPLRAWWFGREISTMQRLGFYDEKTTNNAYHWRENERRILLSTLDEEQVWPSDKYRSGDYIFGEQYPEGIEEATHAFMAKTKSEVFMLQPEDIFQSERIQNLPGTDIDKYPNWRAKQVIDVEDMANSESFKRNINIVKKWR